MTENEMVGWHHGLNGHEFELALGNGEGEGSLVCCSPWGHKESDMTEQLNQQQQHPVAQRQHILMLNKLHSNHEPNRLTH